MCQCGCGEIPIENGAVLPNGSVVAYGIYRGCDTCFSGPAVTVSVFNNARSEWLMHAKLEDFVPDEDGGNHGRGINVGLFEVQDLKAESIELSKEAKVARGGDNYATIADWLDDFGLRLVQGAMRRFDQRIAGHEKQRQR